MVKQKLKLANGKYQEPPLRPLDPKPPRDVELLDVEIPLRLGDAFRPDVNIVDPERYELDDVERVPKLDRPLELEPELDAVPGRGAGKPAVRRYSSRGSPGRRNIGAA